VSFLYGGKIVSVPETLLCHAGMTTVLFIMRYMPKPCPIPDTIATMPAATAKPVKINRDGGQTFPVLA
jgi:hypothetical protein